jgi:hypothetical protein
LAVIDEHDSRVHLTTFFALLDPPLRRAALIVERHRPLGRTRQVGDQKADTREQVA